MARTARRLVSLGLALTAAAGLTACIIHLDDDEPCAAFAIAATFLVNPETLACEDHTPRCDCNGCDDEAVPTWGFCQTQCTGLDANTCAATAGCRQAWDFGCLFTRELCTLPDPYYGCFAVDTTGPVPGTCEGLGPQDCSRHDTCAGAYARDERCGNGTDDDRDGAVDENDECLTFTQCFDERVTR